MTRVSIALAVIIACAPTYVAAQQSLADVARAEEARRKMVETTAAKTAKVYTNDNLKPDNTIPTPLNATPAAPGAVTPPANATPAAPTDPAAPGATPADALRDQAYWSTRMGDARKAVDRSRMFADALQSRINALTTDFTNRDDPAQRSVIEQDRIKALDEMKRVKKDIEDQTKAITAIEDEARRAGVPVGWLR